MQVTEIGVVRSNYVEHRLAPQQAALNPDETAWVEMVPSFAKGLRALDGFDYVWLITWLGDDAVRTNGPLSEVPHLVAHLGHKVGTFATRGPFRPTPIGLHLVRLVSIDAVRLTFRGVDIIDGTPVLDVKPYVKEFDRPGDVDTSSGWYGLVDFESVAKRRGILS
ncbi:MAG: tRNA (N6-threonylcarbamoyladenosine(37)-N6)-methyltransferase TrmO [Thermoleophilia bacterium]|nr:tRNA (N6-threonylcarbamoyladenosine(37)-N6)-methyltransferase TrmO [Thermoleophilia bacterium]